MFLTSALSFVVLRLFFPATTALGQPDERGLAFRPDSLVELVTIDSSIHLDIRYAGMNNFMKRPMYTQPRAFLQQPAARALLRVSRTLHDHGYGLLVFDGYRPWSVTKKFWDETPREKRIFVANPQKGSKHNRGCAVDLSLYRLKDGREVTMTSPYDDFTEKAAAHYVGGTATQRKDRDLLRTVMESEGFTVNHDEWWHFDYRDWPKYRILDIPFEELP